MFAFCRPSVISRRASCINRCSSIYEHDLVGTRSRNFCCVELSGGSWTLRTCGLIEHQHALPFELRWCSGFHIIWSSCLFVLKLGFWVILLAALQVVLFCVFAKRNAAAIYFVPEAFFPCILLLRCFFARENFVDSGCVCATVTAIACACGLLVC